MKELPDFRKVPFEVAHRTASRALTPPGTGHSALHKLIIHEDRHFRALFHANYFALPEGVTEPTKSQWNTLKKRFKRLDHDIFVFKEHGQQDGMYYIDFGYFAY